MEKLYNKIFFSTSIIGSTINGMEKKYISIENKINKDNIFKNIKSNYFLKNLFEKHLKINKKLEIIKYNKNIQTRIGINNQSYKDYVNIFSPIKILIIDKDRIEGKIINIIKDEYKDYIHIYFNENREEVKNKYILTKDDMVYKVYIILDYKIDSLYRLFHKCDAIKNLEFLKFNRNNITNMESMFAICKNLKQIDLTNFNTENVKTMGTMFFSCSNLKELDLSSFNTNKLEDINNMFHGCESLETINLSTFKLNNQLKRKNAFTGTYSLEKIIFSEEDLKDQDFIQRFSNSILMNSDVKFNKGLKDKLLDI